MATARLLAHLAAAAAVACGGSVALRAQATAIVTTVQPGPGSPLSMARDVFIDVDTPAVTAVLVSGIDGSWPNQGHPATATADGRYYVAPHIGIPASIPIRYPLAYRDLATGATGVVVGDAWHIAANPRRPEVYVAFTTGEVGVVDPTGLRRVPVCSSSLPSAMAVSRDGREVYVACFDSLRVLDSRTGSELRRFALMSSPREIHAVADHRLFTLDYAGPIVFGVMEMSIYDVTTGARVANAPTPVAGRGLSWAVPTPDGTQVAVGVSTSVTSGPSTPYLVDGGTAATLAVWPVDQVARLAFLSTSRRAVLLRALGGGIEPMLEAALLDVDSHAVIARGVLGSAWFPDMANVVVVEPPLPPSQLTVAVLGPQVTLAWSTPEASTLATDFIVEAGSTPTSFELLAIRLGSATTGFVAPHVPAGTYYVRVRAVNAAGTGRASAVVEVRVP